MTERNTRTMPDEPTSTNSDAQSDTQCSEGTPQAGTQQSATSEEIEAWDNEHDEPHPVFAVPHRPERKSLEFETADETTSEIDERGDT